MKTTRERYEKLASKSWRNPLTDPEWVMGNYGAEGAEMQKNS